MTDLDPSPPGDGGVAELEPVIRRVIGARVADASTVEDLTQETLARMLAAQSRLDPSALCPYAIVTARNLVRSWARAEERRQRLSPSVVDARRPEDPEQQAMEAEDRRVLAAALDQLSRPDRETLIAHDVEGVETAALARQLGTSPGAVTLRLVRARARLRVEYLLALRRVELPTAACKPVLLALSGGDSRRQRALGVGEHLLGCPPCAELSEPLLQRRRPLAALWPALGLGRVIAWVRRRAHEHPAQTAATGAVAIAAVALIVLTVTDQPSRPVLYVAGDPLTALSGDKPLAPYAGREVRADGATVESVPTPEGFWVGSSRSDRVWVDLDGGGPLSKPVTAGEQVSFEGKLIPNHAELPAQLGLDTPGDAAQLERQGFHISIAEETLQLGPPPERG